jgi:hypothetical protein
MLQRSVAPITIFSDRRAVDVLREAVPAVRNLHYRANGASPSPDRPHTGLGALRNAATRRSLVVLLLPAVPAAASADVTLGTTTQPAGSSPDTCFNSVIGQLTSDASTPYMVPAGGGEITAWQTNTTQAIAGEPLTFVVLKLLAGLTYSVVATDAENLPNRFPRTTSPRSPWRSRSP